MQPCLAWGRNRKGVEGGGWRSEEGGGGRVSGKRKGLGNPMDA